MYSRYMSAPVHILMMLALCLIVLMAAPVLSLSSEFRYFTPHEANQVLRHLYEKQDMVQLRDVAQQIIHHNPKVLHDLQYPSVFQYLGVAQYALGDLIKATETFEKAVRVNDNDIESWIHLGNCYLFQLRLPEAAKVLQIGVLEKGSTKSLHLLFKARHWMSDWRDRQDMLAQIEITLEEHLMAGRPSNINALDFSELSIANLMELNRQTYKAHGNHNISLCCANEQSWRLRSPELRIGFVSSDFGIHPVATLIRGMLALLSGPDHPVKVYCFALTDAGSWWRRNITRSVDYMISLKGKNPLEAARIIHEHQIHVLVDLNGHTLHSGLSIFNYRPSPVQLSYLGYPMTLGSPAIDFFISDGISTPPETSGTSFTEKLLLLPTHYIVNDHMQLLGHTLEDERPLLSMSGGEKQVFMFATFSNWQKIDPLIFSAWMQILARVPSSIMWFLRHKGHEGAERNLREEANAHGIDGANRLIFSELAPWIGHTYVKRAADLVLDTSLKNGHTTMLDALCAGVPMVTLEGNRMSNRASSSALHSLNLHDLTVNSIKEYVEVAVYLATQKHVLQRLRTTVESHRLQYPLFDTAKYTGNFEYAIKAAWQVMKSRRMAIKGSQQQAMHIFPALRSMQVAPRNFPVDSAKDDHHGEDEYEVRVRAAIEAKQPIRLHIGGHVTSPDWWVVDINDGDRVDFVMNMANLYAFPYQSVDAIYASHVLEHCDYGVNREVQTTLLEWHRVLKPNGKLYVAVPDLSVLARLFMNETLSEQGRFWIMSIIYGGQVDAFDVHKVGFNLPILQAFLRDAGFCEFTRVEDFGFFLDSSVMYVEGLPISLNVVAHPCRQEVG